MKTILQLAILGCWAFLLCGCPSSPSSSPGTPITPARGACSVAGLPQPTATDPPIVLNDPNAGGTFSGGTGIIAAPITLNIRANDLIIVTHGNLDVNADILFPAPTTFRGLTTPDILLVSLQGTVTIAPGVTVGGAMATQGDDGTNAKKGSDAGRIEVIGAAIKVDGRILGNQAGRGGNSQYAAGMTGGGIAMKSGKGGFGGTVQLCATDIITIASTARIVGGQGGQAGGVNISATRTSSGTGNDGGNGANVILTGLDPNGTKVQIANQGSIIGGIGGSPGRAWVDLGGNTGGGNATSKSGNAGIGGTVIFVQASVIAVGTVTSGNGGTANGPGGTIEALAVAAKGSDGTLFGNGSDGGNASATAGDGALPGSVPQIPLPGGAIIFGGIGTSGSGGEAKADPGNGGNSGRWSSTGGNSGTGLAQGGANAAGVRPTPPVTSAAVAQIAGVGGIAPAASSQLGTP